MPVELTVVETTNDLGVTTSSVTLTSSSTPGPQGPQGDTGPAGATGATGATGAQGPAGNDGADGEGVPVGGTTGQVLAKASDTDFDTEWVAQTGGGGGTDDQTAAEVPFTPAGNIAATDVQAAVEELDDEKAALSHVHAGEDITSGTVADARIASTIARDSEVTAAVAAEATARDAAIATSEVGQVRDGDAAGGVLAGTYPNPSFAADMATQAEIDAHLNDTADAHDASAISILDTAGDFTATDVEGALAELQSDAESDAADLAAHLADTAGAHDASAISVLDTAGNFTGTNVEVVLAELQDNIDAGGGGTGSAIALDVAQAAHGFSVGNVIRRGSGSYAKAQADSSANAEVIGIVTAVADVDNFTFAAAGEVTGLSGLTDGTTYFLDPSTAGALTATEPTTADQISKPLLIATGTTSGIFVNWRGAVVL